MLDNISSGKRLPEKSLLVLGEVNNRRSREGANTRQGERQRHNENSWSRCQQTAPTTGGRQTEDGSRQLRTSLRLATPTKMCLTPTMRV
jgi:hypothetical protein